MQRRKGMGTEGVCNGLEGLGGVQGQRVLDGVTQTDDARQRRMFCGSASVSRMSL